MYVPVKLLELMGASPLSRLPRGAEVPRPAEMAAAGSTQVLPASLHSKVEDARALAGGPWPLLAYFVRSLTTSLQILRGSCLKGCACLLLPVSLAA